MFLVRDDNGGVLFSFVKFWILEYGIHRWYIFAGATTIKVIA